MEGFAPLAERARQRTRQKKGHGKQEERDNKQGRQEKAILNGWLRIANRQSRLWVMIAQWIDTVPPEGKRKRGRRWLWQSEPHRLNWLEKPICVPQNLIILARLGVNLRGEQDRVRSCVFHGQPGPVWIMSATSFIETWIHRGKIAPYPFPFMAKIEEQSCRPLFGGRSQCLFIAPIHLLQLVYPPARKVYKNSGSLVITHLRYRK